MFEICADNLKAADTTPQELFGTIVESGYQAHVIRKGELISVANVVDPRWRALGGSRLDNYLFKPI